ncbi:MAG: hypothetical protein QNL01_15545 [Akkermansiaceae bacterium]|jgi:hypothetical protein|tara:strand:- start:241 stop:795 length:555 start_codon:yes stop_codon:yes gene_type:complete
MKPNRSTIFFLILTMSLSVFSGALHGNDHPANLPVGFRFIGHYKLNSKIRVENGDTMPVVISPLVYHVYSDGIEVRVYCLTAGEESFTNYEIYRSDGVGVTRKSGEIDVVAGVQAYCTKGGMIRQLSVTRNSLTMVKMPQRSYRVLVTRATVVKNVPTSKPVTKKLETTPSSVLSPVPSPAVTQ